MSIIIRNFVKKVLHIKKRRKKARPIWFILKSVCLLRPLFQKPLLFVGKIPWFLISRRLFYHIISVMWVFYLIPQKSELLHLLYVLRSAFHCIDTGSFDRWMSENIGEPYDVFLQAVKSPCKKVSEVMWKHLVFADAGAFAQIFEHFPYVTSVKRLAVFWNKNRSASDILPLHISA